MGLFGGVSSKQIDEFAKSLADSVAKRYPPALDTAAEKRMSVNRITKVLEDTYSKASDFHRSHRLGVYKKARLGNSFKWELKGLGYSEKFIEVATEGLIVYITREAKPPAATGESG
jgi:hypothetical protein